MSRESGDTIHANTVALRERRVGASPYIARRPQATSIDPLRLCSRRRCRATAGVPLAARLRGGG